MNLGAQQVVSGRAPVPRRSGPSQATAHGFSGRTSDKPGRWTSDALQFVPFRGPLFAPSAQKESPENTA